MSKTILLTDEAYAEIAAALEEKAQGMQMVIDLLTARDGPQCADVLEEVAGLARLTNAAYEFYGVSTWRRNSGSLPVGTIFKPRGGKTS